MFDPLEHLPQSQRPKSIPLFPDAWRFFCNWTSLRWFLLLLIPIAQSTVGAIYRHKYGEAIGVAVLGIALAAMLFGIVTTGRVSWNTGTYYRSREPITFWLEVLAISVWYFVMSIAGWIVD